jgi:cyclophilin family peptidyl-prolyl cis-trans isomerase/HEAT repeat protein
MRCRLLLLTACCLLPAIPSVAQTAARLSILQAEDRRAPTARDLSILQAGARGRDAANALVAIRALGRLERPSLISGLLPALRHALPEVRAEAANAIGQAAQGWNDKPPPATALDPAIRALEARLGVETAPSVRAAIFETLGRLPYTGPQQVTRIERLLIDGLSVHTSVEDRLGIADGLEVLVRRQAYGPPSDGLLQALRDLATLRDGEATGGARVRRLALEALIGTGTAEGELIEQSATDPDAQVRRLTMRLAAGVRPESAGGHGPGSGASLAGSREAAAVLLGGLLDDASMVRLEAVRGLRSRLGDDACPFLIGALKDPDAHVNLMALDQLADCSGLPDAVASLERFVNLPEAGSPRGWHRAAHALVALARADRERAAAALPRFVAAGSWPLRMYSAHAAAALDDRAALERLAADADDNVREAAIEALVKTAGHAADPVYVAALARGGHQVLRAAANALAGTPDPAAAIPALKGALQGLVEEGTDNGRDPRAAIMSTLASLGAPAAPPKGARPPQGQPADFNADDLKRLASPRARISIRGVGSFEIALFTREAPATVLRFARLAESGYYNGLTFHRIVPNFVIQGGSPGANEYIGDDWYMRDEVGLWPHVRGAVGISTRGRDTGDAQFFINTVDNPRLDHEYTVFAQVLNGIEVVDLILEGDVIETIEIIP